MCGGGGRSSSGALASQMAWEQQRRQDIENEQRVLAQQRAEEARVLAEQQKTATTERAAQSRTAAMDAARTRTFNTLRDRGLNPDDYADVVNERLNYNASLLPTNTEDFTGQFGDPFVESVVNTIRDRGRSDASRWFTNNVGNDMPDRVFTNTLDDPYVDAIIGRQRTEAMEAVERAKKRGQLDDSGFAGAVSRIGDLEKSGRATAQSLSNAVVANKRADLGSLIERGKATAGSLDLGQAFNPGEWSNRIQSKATELQQGLEGDVYSALGGQQFFDIGDIITKGGAAQGVANPTPAFLDSQAAREQLRQRQRNAGQGGTF